MGLCGQLRFRVGEVGWRGMDVLAWHWSGVDGREGRGGNQGLEANLAVRIF